MGQVTSTADTSNFIGVNSFAGANAPNVGPTGVPVDAGLKQNFEFNDGDGLLSWIFVTIDIAGFTDLSLSLNYFINSTGFEADDRFAVRISNGTTTATLLNFGELELEANASVDDGTNNFRCLSANLSALGLSGLLTLTIDVDSNAADENICVDNILLQGNRCALAPSPSPGPLPWAVMPLPCWACTTRGVVDEMSRPEHSRASARADVGPEGAGANIRNDVLGSRTRTSRALMNRGRLWLQTSRLQKPRHSLHSMV